MFDRDGFVVIDSFVSSETIKEWLPELEAFRARAGGNHSVRNLVESSLVREIAARDPFRALTQKILGGEPRLVRGILFDKVPGANWSVPWHQDLTIAVEERQDVEGYGPWSVKDGVVHVQPPAEILEHMVTVRVHLDDCGADNGPVRVIPGSNLLGKIPESEIPSHLREERACVGPAGSALVMRPLILHASSPATNPGHRRVLHLEFAGTALPNPLNWQQAARV